MCRLLSRCPGPNRMYEVQTGREEYVSQGLTVGVAHKSPKGKNAERDHQKDRFPEQADLQRGSILFGFFQ